MIVHISSTFHNRKLQLFHLSARKCHKYLQSSMTPVTLVFVLEDAIDNAHTTVLIPYWKGLSNFHVNHLWARISYRLHALPDKAIAMHFCDHIL